jgi:hypothetical protein
MRIFSSVAMGQDMSTFITSLKGQKAISLEQKKITEIPGEIAQLGDDVQRHPL